MSTLLGTRPRLALAVWACVPEAVCVETAERAAQEVVVAAARASAAAGRGFTRMVSLRCDPPGGARAVGAVKVGLLRSLREGQAETLACYTCPGSGAKHCGPEMST